ncbi:hypothetical protein GL213_12660 [Halogeometricum borinquense]|uniref:Uncharacterized protein n=1 Tax=Halogeometricum borinquense TaxID=60847 RepID=A0A6C0UDS2_9EURY|nr:hypothetical protein [Halogeometricum borinquense]QIB73297.1 hypothetical protein G3I44_02765 [Halogeometricum borinquense]QIQ77305.1 hypothetical protein GL213_12660 [Halogeometricum borinquense]
MTDRRSLVFSLAVVVLVVTPVLFVAGSAPATGSSPPVATPFCERPLSESLHAADVDATVESTAAHAVIENESAAWSVNATFENESTVDRILGNWTLKRRLIERASGTLPAERVSAVAAGPRTVSFRFRTDEFAAHAPGGLLRVDYFRVHGSEFRTVSCDQLTVIGPQNYTLATQPEATELTVRADGNRVVLSDTGPHSSASFLVFAPAEMPAVLRGLLASLALVLATPLAVLTNAVFFVCLPGCLLALGFVAVHRLSSLVRIYMRLSARELGLTTLSLALVGAVPLLWFLGRWEPSVLAPLAGIVAGSVLAVVGTSVGPDADRASLLPVFAGVGVAGVAAAVSVFLTQLSPGIAVASMFAVVPPLAGYPLGVAASRGPPPWRIVAVATFGYVITAAAYLLSLDSVGSSSGLLIAFSVLGVLGLVVAAVPFALLGVGSKELADSVR